jgi:hypothetical protein
VTPKVFGDVLAAAHARERATLDAKGAEYAPGFDRLANFRAAAALQRCTPEKALMGMLAKHLVSIADLVNDAEEPPCPHNNAPMCPCPAWRPTPVETWLEKLGDARAYLLLLEALVRERLKEPVEPQSGAMGEAAHGEPVPL